MKNPNRWKHVAVLISGGRIVGSAMNEDKYHAEDLLLYGWEQEARGATVLSIRVKKDGSFANAKPCKNCWQILKKAGVKKVRWTEPEGDKALPGLWEEARL